MIDKKAIYSKVMKSVDELIHKKLEEGYFNNVELNSDDSVTDDIIKSDLYYSNAISRICYTLGLDDKTIKEIYKTGKELDIDLSQCLYVFEHYPENESEYLYCCNVLINTIVFHLIEHYPSDLLKDINIFKAYLNKINHINDITPELDKLSFSKSDRLNGLKIITDSICKNFVINPKYEYDEEDLKVCLEHTSYMIFFDELPLKFKKMLYTICNFRIYRLMWNLTVFVQNCLICTEFNGKIYDWKYDYLDNNGKIVQQDLSFPGEYGTDWKAVYQKRFKEYFTLSDYPFVYFMRGRWLGSGNIRIKKDRCNDKINLCCNFINGIYGELLFFCLNEVKTY